MTTQNWIEVVGVITTSILSILSAVIAVINAAKSKTQAEIASSHAVKAQSIVDNIPR